MTSPRSSLRLPRPFLVAAVMLAAFAYPSAASADTLYASNGAGCNASSLYTLDPSNGSVVTGPTAILVGGNPAMGVTGLAVRPSDGTLFALMKGDPGTAICSTGDYETTTLITIN